MSQTELGNLKLVEDTLDSLIKSCAQQLFDITDNTENAAYPFTTELPQNEEASRLLSVLVLGSTLFFICSIFGQTLIQILNNSQTIK